MIFQKSLLLSMKKNSSTFNLDTICIKDGDCIATDGYRLERCPLLLQKPVMLSSGVVKFLTQKGIMSGNVNIKYSEKWLNLSNPITNILTRFPEESYPDYTAVIPENNPLITVIVDRNKTLEVIKSFASLVDTRNPAIRVSINGAMELSCGNTRATIPVIYDKEAEVSFLINRSYLEDALKVSKTADCRLNYYQEGKPIIITSTDQFSLIMPRRE
jgi:DNA polymerase III sliding clamp (beta) subunit (PCNA family)